MKYTLNHHGELKRDGLTVSCPISTTDMECGNWCPLFREHDNEWAVTLHCAPNPLTYKIDDVEQYNGN